MASLAVLHGITNVGKQDPGQLQVLEKGLIGGLTASHKLVGEHASNTKVDAVRLNPIMHIGFRSRWTAYISSSQCVLMVTSDSAYVTQVRQYPSSISSSSRKA